MALKLPLTESVMFESTFKTRDICFSAMNNKSSLMNVSHCPPEWDQSSELCWGPTPVGVTAKLPCPDDLNINQFATRKCLQNGSWYINQTVDGNAYTNFHDCFLPADPSSEDDLRKLVNHQIIQILKSLDEYKKLYLILHVVSITMLVASIIISAAVVVKLKQKHHLTYSYTVLAIAAAALLVNNAVTVSVSAVDDAINVLKCRLAKSLILISSIVFYQCIFVYFYMCIVPILQIAIRTILLKVAIVTAIIVAIILVISEQFAEILSCPSRYCGFRTLQSKYHWLTTAPRIMLIMSNICLHSVTTFGVFYLKQPHLEKGCQLRHIRQKVFCALVVLMFYTVLEILFVLIHTEAYMRYSELPVDFYLQAYSFAVAIQGIVFTVLMCFLDLEVLAMIGLPVKCKSSQDWSTSSGTQTGQTQALSNWHCDVDSNTMYDFEYPTTPEVEKPPGNDIRVELVFHTARPEDSTDIQVRGYESSLFLGSQA